MHDSRELEVCFQDKHKGAFWVALLSCSRPSDEGCLATSLCVRILVDKTRDVYRYLNKASLRRSYNLAIAPASCQLLAWGRVALAPGPLAGGIAQALPIKGTWEPGVTCSCAIGSADHVMTVHIIDSRSHKAIALCHNAQISYRSSERDKIRLVSG